MSPACVQGHHSLFLPGSNPGSILGPFHSTGSPSLTLHPHCPSFKAMAHLTWVGGGQGSQGALRKVGQDGMGASGPRRWTFAAGLGHSSFPHLPHPPTHFPPLSLRHLLSHLPLIELSSSFLTTLFIKIKELNVLTFFFPFSQVFISWETKISCWTCVWPRGDAPWQQCPLGPAPALGVLRGEMGLQSCLQVE